MRTSAYVVPIEDARCVKMARMAPDVERVRECGPIRVMIRRLLGRGVEGVWVGLRCEASAAKAGLLDRVMSWVGPPPMGL